MKVSHESRLNHAHMLATGHNEIRSNDDGPGREEEASDRAKLADGAQLVRAGTSVWRRDLAKDKNASSATNFCSSLARFGVWALG